MKASRLTFVSKAAYSTRWHLYVSAGQGSFMDGSFPRKLLLNIDNTTIPVNYGVRACKELRMPGSIQSQHKLMIHGSLRGCKGWRLEAAHGLPATHRFCVCDQEAAKRRERNEAYTLNPRPKTAHEALGKGPPKQCSRFLQGLCLRNKRGVRCNLSHEAPGAWIDNKCTIRCRLHPHKKIPGVCLNGPACTDSSHILVRLPPTA